jgi:hypothetical protein
MSRHESDNLLGIAIFGFSGGHGEGSKARTSDDSN